MTGERQTPSEPAAPSTSSLASRAGEILESAGLDLIEGVTLDQFSSVLSQLVYEVTMASMSFQPRGKRAGKVERLGKAYETYVRLTRELRADGLHPPMLPLALREDIERWIADFRTLIENPGEDHSRRGSLYHFYPRVIGLFYAAFDQEPTSWCGNGGNASRLVTFANCSISFARDTVDLAALTGIAPNRLEAFSTPWYERSLAAIHEQLKKSLLEGLDPVEDQVEPVIPDWVIHYGYFYDILRR